MIRLGCFAVIAAVVCIGLGIQAWIAAAHSSKDPVTIKYSDLKGWQRDQNPYVTVNDLFIASFDGIVGKKAGTRTAWIPAIDAGGSFAADLRKWTDARGGPDTFPRKGGLRLLIKTTDTSDQHLMSLMSQHSITGMLVDNDVGIIKGMMLNKYYDSGEVRRCLVIEEGATPAGTLIIAGYFGGGLALLLLGLGLIVGPALGRRKAPVLAPEPTFAPPPQT